MRTKLVIVLLVGAILCFVWVWRDPMRTPVPDSTADDALLAAPLARLGSIERDFVIGYLLRKRKETPSTLMRDDREFLARTFREAIAAQRGFLKREGYASPRDFLRIGARDALLAPLRAAVDVRLARRDVRRQPDSKPVLVIVYRISNDTHDDIAEVSGVVTIRRARYDVATSTGIFTSCAVDVDDLAAGERRLFDCVNPAGTFTADDAEFRRAGPGDLHLTWSPESIRFTDGRVLDYEDGAVDRTRIWGRYPVTEAAR